MTKRRLVVLEGPDGVGKTTLSTLLVQRLAENGVDVAYESFPGKDPASLGGWVYRLHHEDVDVDRDALQVAHVAAHVDAVRRRIVPALEGGRTVVLDRYWWSTLAYGEVTGCSMPVIEAAVAAERAAWGDVRPDIIFLVDRERPHREEHAAEKHAALRDAYRQLAERFPLGVRYFPNDLPVLDSVGLLASQVLDGLPPGS